MAHICYKANSNDVTKAHDDVIFIAERLELSWREEAESHAWVLKIERTFAQVCSSTIYDLTTQCYPHSQQDVNAPSLPASSLYTETVVSPSRCEELCVTMLSTPDSRKGPSNLLVKLLSISLGAWVKVASCKTVELGAYGLDKDRGLVLFIVHAKDSMARIEYFHVMSSPSRLRIVSCADPTSQLTRKMVW